jgi:hypothetical protein
VITIIMERSTMLPIGGKQRTNTADGNNVNNRPSSINDKPPPRLRITMPKKQQQQQPQQQQPERQPLAETLPNTMSSSIATTTTLANISPTPSKKQLPPPKQMFVSSSSSNADTNNNDNDKGTKQYDEWPTSSATSLPPLTEHLTTGLENKGLHLPINEECKY